MVQENEQLKTCEKPRVWATLKKSFVKSYDYLGLVLLASIVWTGLGGAISALVFAVARGNAVVTSVGLPVLYVLVLSPVTAGIYYLAHKIAVRGDPCARDLLDGAKEFMTASWKLGLAQIILTAIVILNIWFYFRTGKPILMSLGVVFLYILLFWLSSMVYHYPVLIEQRPGTLQIVKKGFLLVADNVAFTAGLFFVIILLTCLSAASVFLLALVYPGTLCIIGTFGLRAMFVKYGIIEPDAEPADGEDKGFRIREKDPEVASGGSGD